jgi:hypothetical protein
LVAKKRVTEVINREELSSEEEVKEALRFAQRISQAYTQNLGIYPSAFNPVLLNQRMQEMTLRGTTGTITSDGIQKALENPTNSENELLSISESFEITSTPYRRLISYMSNMLAWDLTYYCKNITENSEYTSKKYKKDLDVIKNFLYCFDVKKEFSAILRELYRTDTFFGVLRDEGDRYTIQQLPSHYSKITGRFDYGLLYSFDYSFFLRQGMDMDLFPPIFKETYGKIFTRNNTSGYDPSINIDLRGDSTWVYWVDCSPADGFWGFKLNPTITNRTPYFCGLFPDLANQNLIRNLQKNSYMTEAVKILTGKVEMLKDTKASVKDAYAMSPEVLGKYLQLIRSAINESVNVVAAPLDSMGAVQFDGNNEIQSSWTRNTIGTAGVNSNLLYSGGDQRMNIQETLYSVDIDSFVSEEVYPWFNYFLEYEINKRTSYYKFGFNFEGTKFHTDIQRRREAQSSLMGVGIVLPQKIAAAHQMNPFSFQAQLDEARANGWTDNLTPIVPAAQQAAGAQAGRPSKSQDKLSESGEETQSAGSNLSKVKKNK